jgi:hypothetical protein
MFQFILLNRFGHLVKPRVPEKQNVSYCHSDVLIPCQ